MSASPSAEERWTENDGIRLHYLDTRDQADAAHLPVVFLPGALGQAEDFRSELNALAPRRAVAMSLRGRGKSDTPMTGFTFAEHVGDVEAVIADAGLRRFCLFAYSMSVPFAIEYAARHPEQVAGMIIGDYPAQYPAIPPEWAKRAAAAGFETPRFVLDGIQVDSDDTPLWDRLPQITCPVLIIRGDAPDAMLNAAQVEQYVSGLKQAMAIVFRGSGHRLWEPDAARYLNTLRYFLEGLDAAESA